MNLKLARYAWFVLFYNVAVIVWGAFVRASKSGAGCGSHWPACNGQFIPSFQSFETAVEFSHRVTSGLVLPLILGLLYWVYRTTQRGSPIRKAVFLGAIFTCIEALIGAGLVRYELVDENSSIARAVVMSAHLANTFCLLACLTLAAWWCSGKKQISLTGQGPISFGLILGLFGLLVLGVSGAITALGDTLFPVRSFLEGLQQDFSPTAHFLVRLRFLHPLIATSVGLYLVLILGLVNHLRPSRDVRFWSRLVIALFGVQLVLGLTNVIAQAPIELQLIHLLLADVLWIGMVLAIASALGKGVQKIELASAQAQYQTNISTPALSFAKICNAYIALTKPRVISLLLFTTLAGMVIAEGRWPSGWLLLAVTLGGYMSAGAANAINMVIDSDIDGRMERTSKRPTVTHIISPHAALCFAFVLALGSFVLLSVAANLLCAVLSLAGLAFYVVIYSLLLKRRTWHNIVIGGAAGAFPPLVGYAAVTNNLTPLAWCLFGIIFVWTPVHFWALALYIKEDYRKAGIPMLPVVHGDRVTIIQIAFYTVLTVVISLVPFLQKDTGLFYLYTAAFLNLILVVKYIQLYMQPDHAHAKAMFKFSMAYLALLFLVIAIDRSISM